MIAIAIAIKVEDGARDVLPAGAVGRGREALRDRSSSGRWRTTRAPRPRRLPDLTPRTRASRASGAFLRRWSLDELPQLWNVLRGEMSIVGPRPTLRYQVDQYDEFQRRRLEVLPGVTGWAQVNGPERADLAGADRARRLVRGSPQLLARSRHPRLDVKLLFRPTSIYNDAQGDWGEHEARARPASARAGTPATRAPPGTSSTTTAPAATRAPGSDGDPLDDDGADADEGAVADPDLPGDQRAGADVHVRADAAVVFHDRARVDDGVLAELRVCVDDGAGEYVAALARSAPGRRRLRWHESPAVARTPRRAGGRRLASSRRSTRRRRCRRTRARRPPTELASKAVWALHRDPEKVRPGSARVLIDHGDHLEFAARWNRLDEGLRVPACAEAEDRGAATRARADDTAKHGTRLSSAPGGET